MEIFYEFKGLFDEKANRTLVFARLKKIFSGEVEKRLWTSGPPAIEVGDIGGDSDAWGSMAVGDYKADVTQLLQCLLNTSGAFSVAEVHLRADDCPGFVLDGKTEILQGGRYGRYARQFAQFCEQHKPGTTPWDFMVDPRIWSAVVQKTPDLSENQILTRQLVHAVELAHGKLRDAFLGFPIEYPGISRSKKELKIPQELAARVQATADHVKLTRQELTERAVYAGLLK